jgi:hypothetical protein
MIFTPLVIAVLHSATPAEAITLVDAITYSTNLRTGNHVCVYAIEPHLSLIRMLRRTLRVDRSNLLNNRRLHRHLLHRQFERRRQQAITLMSLFFPDRTTCVAFIGEHDIVMY